MTCEHISFKCCDFGQHLESLDGLFDTLLQPLETLSEMLLQDLIGSVSTFNGAQIMTVVINLGRKLMVRPQLLQDVQNLIEIVRLGKAKEALIDNLRVDESSNMQTSGVTCIDHPFCDALESCSEPR